MLERAAQPRPGTFGLGLRHGALLEEEERRRRRDREERRGDEHRDRDGLRGGHIRRRGAHDVRKTDSEGGQAAEIAERPAPARDASHGARVGELGEERRDQVLARAEEVIGQDEKAERERDLSRGYKEK